jgi:hypothetical protein
MLAGTFKQIGVGGGGGSKRLSLIALSTLGQAKIIEMILFGHYDNTY